MIERPELTDRDISLISKTLLGEMSVRILREALSIPHEIPTFFGVYDQATARTPEHPWKFPFAFTQTPEEKNALEDGILKARAIEFRKRGRISGSFDPEHIQFEKFYYDPYQEAHILYEGKVGYGHYNGVWRFSNDITGYTDMGVEGRFIIAKIENTEDFMRFLKSVPQSY